MSEAKPKRRSRLLPALLLVVAVLAMALVALYLARRVIAREALTGWLESRGIASQAEVHEIGPERFAGRLQIGDPRSPDFVAGDAEVTYALRGLGVEVHSVRLVRPVLRARVREGRFSVGALDPLIEEFRRRPPRPDARQPRIEIDDGVIHLATDHGRLQATADALVVDGKLMSLTAASAPARLKGAGYDASLGQATLGVTTTGGRVAVRLEAPVSGSVGRATLASGRVTASVNAPYPDLVKRRGDGAVTVAVRLAGERLTAADRILRAPAIAASFSGQAAGWIPDLHVSGKLAAELSAEGGDLGPAQSGVVRAALTSRDLRWTRAGGDRVSATLRLTGTANRVTAADLTLTDLVLAATGPLAADAGGVRLSLGGSAVGRGRYTGFGAPTADDSADLAAVKRAAAGFRFAAPAVQLSTGAELSARLVQPLRILPDRGGEVRLAQSGPAWLLAASGGGLPILDARFTRVNLGARPSAEVTLRTELSIGPLVDARIDAEGRAVMTPGGVAFTGSRCASVEVPRLEFGENDVENLSGRLCPAGSPLFTFGASGWRLSGRAEGLAASVPFLQARLSGGAGPVLMGLRGGRLHADIKAEAGRVLDASPQTRFNPLALSGQAQLAAEVWTADFAFATPAAIKVASARLRHEMLTGEGGVEIDTGPLQFVDGGLQPADLSPLVSALGTGVAGKVRFGGLLGWTPELGISAGKLDVERLDFKSPAGQVTGLSGVVNLTSLAPLVAAPGQAFKAERLDALVPLTDLSATLELKAEALVITGGLAAVEGGRVRVETLEVPLVPEAAIRGVLSLEGVQLKNLVEASPFGGWMDMDAVVTGRVPFETQAGNVRIAAGELKAIQPGRLSIRRELFTGAGADVVQATSETPVPDPNQTFTDMAYQAMENLAFSELAATLNSQPDGRMGALFHIKGRHDPPQKQEIRLTVMDLIRQRFMGKPLPLPSGTEVNLTLDTTLNLDQLLADYADFRRTRGSAPVQP